MPNWCKGDLKIRGNTKDIINFLNKGVYVQMSSLSAKIDAMFASRTLGKVVEPKEDCPENGMFIDEQRIQDVANQISKGLYHVNEYMGIKICTSNGAYALIEEYPGRAFIAKNGRKNIVVNLETDENGESLAVIPMEFEYDVNSSALAKISKKYNIDFKIFAFEKGMQFNRDIEILKGNVLKNNEIHYDDYQWECPCPNIGG